MVYGVYAPVIRHKQLYADMGRPILLVNRNEQIPLLHLPSRPVHKKIGHNAIPHNNLRNPETRSEAGGDPLDSQ